MSRLLRPFPLVLIFNLLLLGYFHNRSWVPADDGLFVHIAERLLGGETLNIQVTEHHAGYIHFVNAAALKWFGKSLVSLRYPAVAVTFLQSLLIFFLFLRRGSWLAALAALGSTSLGFIQMASPHPLLYTLSLTVLIVCLLEWMARGGARNVILGALIMTVFLFRQLTGAFVGFGVLLYLMFEAREIPSGKPPWFARAMVAAIFLLLSAYLIQTTGALGFILFGLWPLLILLRSFFSVTISDKSALKLTGQLLLGGILGLLPTLAYHGYHHSIGAWFYDSFIGVFHLTQLKHIKIAKFAFYLAAPVANLKSSSGIIPSAINSFYWPALASLAFLNGLFLFRYLKSRSLNSSGESPSALPVVSVFYGMVSLLNAIPFYLYATAGLSLVSLLWLAKEGGKKRVAGWCLMAATMCAAGIYYHAGQPYTRSPKEMLNGTRGTLAPSRGLAKSGLWMDRGELETYSKLIEIIRKETQPDQPIFVMPNNAEIYFLAGRKNPFRFWNTAISISNDAEAETTARQILEERPRLIIYHGQYHYNTPQDETILRALKERYVLIERVGNFDVYRYS